MTEHWIIVGAGSAGCVLANRLSADGTRMITLLDDGPPLLPDQVPAGIDGPSFFDAMAEPGRLHVDLMATRAAGIEPSLYQRGRGIGGSSAVNAQVALRGSDAIYRSWGWTDTTDAYQRVAIPTWSPSDAEVGPVDRALRAHPLGEPAQLTRANGHRVTAAEAYLWPALDRANLEVRPNSEVRTVALDGNRAVGVTLADGTELNADRVIVAAGAIHSPAVLLRSGVTTPGIGQSLQDHPSAVFALQLKDGVDHDPSTLPIASTLHATVDGNLLQVLPMNHLGATPENAGLGALMAALMTPVGAAGSVTIDATGAPVVNFAMLEDAADVRALTAAVRLALDVLDTAAFRDIVEAVYIDDIGTTADALAADAAIEAWLRANCADYVHATSTCAMGTVVDNRGSVIGYDALSVVDASIFPHVPDANTHFPTTMLAERLSPLLGQ